MTRFVTSDHHFRHGKIIEHCNREFENANEMDEKMTGIWNETVSESDTVIHGGDIAFTNDQSVAEECFEQLDGQKMLILGNHDDSIDPESFNYPTVEQVRIHNRGFRFWYTHRPESVPEYWTEWIIHGHVHNNEPFIDYDKHTINVSVDVTEYKPIPVPKIVDALKKMSNGERAYTVEEAPVEF